MTKLMIAAFFLMITATAAPALAADVTSGPPLPKRVEHTSLAAMPGIPERQTRREAERSRKKKGAEKKGYSR